ncbi:MAG TPA: ATP-binding protein [Magnetospirillaceae bacterium]|jgi:two-component system sensor histidine kinase RpfC
MLGRLRAALGAFRARLRNRPDSEHEQALVRPIVASALFVYLVPETLLDRQGLGESDYVLIASIAAFLAISVAIFISVLSSSRISPIRRLFSITVDLTAVTYFMSQTDMRALPLSLAYVWITLANGFRFGPAYLLYSLISSVVGFALVIWFNPFFHGNVALGVGLILGMVALDLYVLSLVKKMFRALARAEAANQAKRRFISVVSHEMRTPLNAIIGMGDLLTESKLAPEQGEMARTLTAASRTLMRLIEDVLDFSKIEAGRLVIEQADFDLHALVNGTVRILRPQAEAKGLALTVSIMPEVPHALCGDPHHLRQVLINLVSNAVKFTAQGSVIVHLSQLAEDDGTSRIKFSVRDTGIGIPPEVQDRIFESFVQADQSTTRKYGGTGLGTAIAKQLVELMGGRMGLESAVGLGSTFWFEVDFGKQAATPAAANDGLLTGAPVLLIGFPAAENEIVAQMLRGWGASTIAAGTIESAVQHLAAAESSMPIHSVLLHADRIDTARQTTQALRRGGVALPPMMLCLAPASGRVAPLPVPADLASSFSAVLHMPIQSRLLFNAMHAVSAQEERDTAPGVVNLRDYLQKRGQEIGFRVIVADDAATNRQVIGKILERGGHVPTLVPDGEDVLDAIEDRDFDLIILDRNMPGMDGIATARALRALEGASGHRLPIIILSADVAQEARDECLASGADLFLPKPLEAMRLLEEVAQLCGASVMRRPVPSVSEVSHTSSHMLPAANIETLRLLEDLGSNPGFVERLITTFVKDQSELMVEMERAVDAADYAEVRRLMHAMKGSASSLGADRLAEICSRTQRLTDDEMRRDPTLVQTVRQEFDRARAAFDRHIEERRRTVG